MTTIILLAAFCAWPKLPPPPPVDQGQGVAQKPVEGFTAEDLQKIKDMTPAEARAIDERFMQKNHYRLCPGTCGMMCAAHGGGWRLEPGPADPDDPNQQPAPDTAAAGHWEKRCGPNGCQQVWVSDKQEVLPLDTSYGSGTITGRRWLRRW
jgi:hypothetical protein